MSVCFRRRLPPCTADLPISITSTSSSYFLVCVVDSVHTHTHTLLSLSLARSRSRSRSRALSLARRGVRTTTPPANAGKLYFKCELFQRVGAFKFRGALNAIRKLGPEITTVVTHSSGNHAQVPSLSLIFG